MAGHDLCETTNNRRKIYEESHQSAEGRHDADLRQGEQIIPVTVVETSPYVVVQKMTLEKGRLQSPSSSASGDCRKKLTKPARAT